MRKRVRNVGEMIADGLRRNEQSLGDLLRGPPPVMKQHRLDPITHPTVSLLLMLCFEVVSFVVAQHEKT